MALFALREGYRVETTPTGGRVVHVRTGDTLELNFNEIQLLARAAAGGLQVGDPAIKPIVRKLSGLGLLQRVSGGDEGGAAPGAASTGEPAPDGARVDEGLWVFAPPQDDSPAPASGPEAETEVAELPKPAATAPPAAPSEEPSLDFAAPAEPQPAAPEPLPSLQSPDLLVPVFRTDLVLKRKDKGGIFDVTDPANGKTFAFYDFEISIARMLNGQRRFGEVIAAANALGIPVSVESLSQFVRQLQRYGFLAPDGTSVEDAPSSSIWGKRAKWNNSIRTLYQSGLRLTRQGRYYEAAAYFEAILEHDPGNPEAVEMVEQVRGHLAKLPADAPPPRAHRGPAAGDLAATQEGLPAVEAELPAAESSLESLDGSIGDPAAVTTTDQPLPEPAGPATVQAGAEEAFKLPTEVSDLGATLAAADQPADWAEFVESAPATPARLEMPDEPPPFDPFAEPIAAVQPLGLNAPPAPEPPPKGTFDPFADSPMAAAPDPFPVAPLKTRTPTVNPFARPVDRPVDPPRATPDPFAAIPPPSATPAAANPIPDAQPFDPFADNPQEPVLEGQQPLESLLNAEPELPKFDVAAPTAAPPGTPAPQAPAPGVQPVAPAPAAEIALDLAQAVESPAEPARPAPSLAEAVLEPIPDETVEVESVEAGAEAPAEVEIEIKPVAGPGQPEALAGTAAAVPAPALELSAGPSEPTAPATLPPAQTPPEPAAVRPSSALPLPSPKLAPPPSSMGKYLFGGLGLAALAGAAIWYFGLRKPATPRPPPAPPAVAVAGPDAQLPAPGPDAAAAGVEIASVDASAAAATAEAGPDAAVAEPDAAEPGPDAAVAGPDAAAPAPAPAGDEEGWTAVNVAKRRRVNMGDLKAPIAGAVTWGVAPMQERIRKGQVVGKLADADGNEVALLSPNVGLLAPKAADGATVQANEVIASVPYFEAYGQTPFPGTVAPTPEWQCEVVDEATGQTAPCKVNKADARKSGFFVTFTAEPLWFDTAAKLKLRLKQP